VKEAKLEPPPPFKMGPVPRSGTPPELVSFASAIRGTRIRDRVPLSLAIAIPVHGKCELAHIAVPQARVTLMVGNKPNGTRVEMKALVATIALLCLSSAVLAHDIYSNSP
jgi:hypothetical protein